MEKDQKANVEKDDLEIPITSDDDEDGSEDEDVLGESLCEPTKMPYMLKLMLACHAWYQKGHTICLETPTDKKNFPMQSEL